MRRPAATALAAALLLHAFTSRAEEACAECRAPRDLSLLFVPAQALGAEWETVAEMPVDPADDPELRSAGVRALTSLHYTRPLPGGSQVCSVELWAFHTPEQARRAQTAPGRESWHVAVHGDLIVMLRGVRFARGEGFQPGMLPECRRLAGLIESRVAAWLRPPASRAK